MVVFRKPPMLLQQGLENSLGSALLSLPVGIKGSWELNPKSSIDIEMFSLVILMVI